MYCWGTEYATAFVIPSCHHRNQVNGDSIFVGYTHERIPLWVRRHRILEPVRACDRLREVRARVSQLLLDIYRRLPDGLGTRPARYRARRTTYQQLTTEKISGER